MKWVNEFTFSSINMCLTTPFADSEVDEAFDDTEMEGDDEDVKLKKIFPLSSQHSVGSSTLLGSLSS